MDFPRRFAGAGPDCLPNWYTPGLLESDNRRRPMSGQKAVDGVQPARLKEGQRLMLLRKSGVGTL